MASLNKVILIGHLVADPELKTTANGVAISSFRIGVTRRFTKAGEQPQSDFINIVAWRQQAEFVTKYFHKGNPILVVGSLQSRDYTDQQGNRRYVTEVVADELSFIEKKGDGSAPVNQYTPSGNDAPAYGSAMAQTPKFEEVSGDDDLPF